MKDMTDTTVDSMNTGSGQKPAFIQAGPEAGTTRPVAPARWRWTSLAAGVVLGAALVAAPGARRDDAPAGGPDERPKYEIAAWGNDKAHGAFVVNVETGELLSVTGRTLVGSGNRMTAEYAVQAVGR